MTLEVSGQTRAGPREPAGSNIGALPGGGVFRRDFGAGSRTAIQVRRERRWPFWKGSN
jgi:hypothetical protein